jgi:hypothetical protein
LSAKTVSRAEPPACPYNNLNKATRHPDGLDCRTCPTCVARNRWTAAVRRDRLAAGLIKRDNTTQRGHKPNPALRVPVPKCRTYHPTVADKRACRGCKARDRYTSARLRDARRAGETLVGLVDAAPIADYVNNVLEPSGLNQRRIGDLSGVDPAVIHLCARGARRKIHAINAAAILSVKPLDYRMNGKGQTVNATGTRRMLRGLYAQGWTTGYMAELVGTSLSNLWHWVSGTPRGTHKCESVQPEIAEAAKRLVDKLGAFDIANLDKPLDGMSILCARRAAKKGWLPLDAWDGLDIHDPRVRPHGYDDALDASNGLVLVDPSKVELALDFEPIEEDAGDGRATVSAHRFTIPVTKLELYEIIRVGSERDHAGVVRFSANLLSQRLGIAERTVQRCRTEMTRANWVLDAAPSLPGALAGAQLVLDTDEWPAAFRLAAAADLLAHYPIRRGFLRDLVVLGATQPRPYGRGWSDAELAGWLGCTAEHAAALRSRAVIAGRQFHSAGGAGTRGRSRRLGFTMPAAA